MAVRPDDLLERLADALRRLGIPPENLPPDRVWDVLRSVGMDFDRALVEEDVARALAPLRRAVAAGRAPDAALVDTISRSFLGRMVTGGQSVAKRMVEDFALSQLAEADDSTGPDAPYIWLAAMDGRTCESCSPRHGQERTLAQWASEGRPGSEVLVCGDRCRCQIWPVEAAGRVIPLRPALAPDTQAEAERAVEELLLDLADRGVDLRAETQGDVRSFGLEAMLRRIFREAA